MKKNLTVKKLDKEMLFKIWEAQGMSEEEINKMKQIFEDIFEAATKVKKDYTDNPSKTSGAVDTTKGLVSGSGIQIHSEAIPDEENDDWELAPKIKLENIKDIKTDKEK